MSSYSEGQTHLLMDSLEAKGWSADDVTKLGQAKSEQHLAFRDVLNGRAVISYPQHLIDCDALPYCPDGWEVVEHRKHGQLQWDPTRIRLHLSKKQMDGKVIEGNKLRKELEGLPVMNANVLDYLLKHTELIPDEYKGKAVFFWGTIYRRSDGRLYVRCLFWDGGKWDWRYRWLGYGFDGSNPAAVSASI